MVTKSMSLLTGVGTIGGLAGLAMGVRSAATEIDKIAKSSARLGIATENLVGLHHAGQITGVTIEKMDSSLERFVKRLGEAKQGTGEARKGLEELGLEAKDFDGLKLDQKVALLADRFKGLNTAEEKAAVAAKLFGREGVALVNTLDLGSKGLANMQKEAERLGLTFSKEDAAKVEEFNDALTRLKATASGAFRDFTIKIAPDAAKAIDSFAKAAPEWKETAVIFGKAAKDFLTNTSEEESILKERETKEQRLIRGERQRRKQEGRFFAPKAQGKAKTEAGAITASELMATGMSKKLAEATVARMRGDEFHGGKFFPGGRGMRLEAQRERSEEFIRKNIYPDLLPGGARAQTPEGQREIKAIQERQIQELIQIKQVLSRPEMEQPPPVELPI